MSHCLTWDFPSRFADHRRSGTCLDVQCVLTSTRSLCSAAVTQASQLGNSPDIAVRRVGISTSDYRGVLVLRFKTGRPDPSHSLLGQLLVDRALSAITAERLTEQQAAEARRAANLETALTTSREIGIAMGIIMARHKLTVDSAFDLLRRISQHSQRKYATWH